MKTKFTYTAVQIRKIIQEVWVGWDQMQTLFHDQVMGYNKAGSTATPEQRDHIYRFEFGRAAHVNQVNPTHAELIAYRIGHDSQDLFLFDGFTRMYRWLTTGHCEFEELKLKLYTLESKDDLDWLYASINSMKAAKDNRDHFAAAMNIAGLTGRVSGAYRNAAKSRSFFKRVIGLPSDGIHRVATKVSAFLKEHRHMDALFSHIEDISAAAVSKGLHAGIATSVFGALQHIEKHENAQMMLCAAAQTAIRVYVGKQDLSINVVPGAAEMLKALDEAEDYVTEVVRTSATKVNRETQYNLAISVLLPAFTATAEKVAAPRKRKPRAKAA